MGLSNTGADIGAGGSADSTTSMASSPTAAPAASGPAHQSFGDKLGAYMASKYPVAGGLAGQVFGVDQAQQAPTQPGMPQQQNADFGLVDGHAGKMVNSSSGIGTILKLIGL